LGGFYPGETVSGARVYLKIYTVAGRMVWSQTFGELEASTGEHALLWDCRDRTGSALANGAYYFSVTVEVKDQRHTKLTPLLILK
jgi:flagellar hook assembly protein FlgD